MPLGCPPVCALWSGLICARMPTDPYTPVTLEQAHESEKNNSIKPNFVNGCTEGNPNNPNYFPLLFCGR